MTTNPQNVVFNSAGVGTTLSSNVILTANHGEIQITALQFTNPVFATTLHTPFMLNPGRPVTVPISFIPRLSIDYSGEMQVLHGSSVVATVPLTGTGLCLTADCEPKGPICAIKKGNESWQPLILPNFFETVTPAIEEQAHLHYRRTEYDLPVDFILRATGLATFVKFNPALGCDDKDLHFTPIAGSTLRDRFQRKPGGFDAVAEGTVSTLYIRLKIPKDMSGTTVVGGGFSEFHFDEGKEPNLLIKEGADAIFDGDIKCMNVTFSSSTICQTNPGTVLPHLNLEVK